MKLFVSLANQIKQMQNLLETQIEISTKNKTDLINYLKQIEEIKTDSLSETVPGKNNNINDIEDLLNTQLKSNEGHIKSLEEQSQKLNTLLSIQDNFNIKHDQKLKVKSNKIKDWLNQIGEIKRLLESLVKTIGDNKGLNNGKHQNKSLLEVQLEYIKNQDETNEQLQRIYERLNIDRQYLNNQFKDVIERNSIEFKSVKISLYNQIKEGFIKDYGLEKLSISTAKEYVNLGKKTYDCYNQIITDPYLIPNMSFDNIRNPFELIDGFPELINKVSIEREKYNTTILNLNKDIEIQKGKIIDIQKENYELSLKIKSLEEEINTMNNLSEIGTIAQETYNKLTKDVEAPFFNSKIEIKTWFKSLPELLNDMHQNPNKLKSIEKLIWLDAYLDQGQRNYFDKDPDNNIASAAMLSFLINHSLVELCFAVYLGDEIKIQGMLNNLFIISDKLNNKSIYGFDAALKWLKDQFPLDSSSQLPWSVERDSNGRYFQVVLDQLKAVGIDISPFYFNIDENKKLRRAGW